jgi:hypothetical protein
MGQSGNSDCRWSDDESTLNAHSVKPLIREPLLQHGQTIEKKWLTPPRHAQLNMME